MRPTTSQYLTRQQIAAEYPVSADYLARLAQAPNKRRLHLPPGPPIIRLGSRKVVYERRAFELWLSSQSTESPSAPRRGRPTKTAEIAKREAAAASAKAEG